MTRFFNGVEDAIANQLLRAKQNGRVDVPLHPNAGAEATAGFRHVHGPIDADNIDPRLTHQVKNARAAADVENQRGVGVGLLHLLHHSLLVGQSKGPVVHGAQLAGPGVEELHNLSPTVDLVAHVGGNIVGQLAQQGVQHRRFRERHALDVGVVLRGFALHRVGGQGPGGAHKA